MIKLEKALAASGIFLYLLVGGFILLFGIVMTNEKEDYFLVAIDCLLLFSSCMAYYMAFEYTKFNMYFMASVSTIVSAAHIFIFVLLICSKYSNPLFYEVHFLVHSVLPIVITALVYRRKHEALIIEKKMHGVE